jgi:hypothetical protein
MAALRTRFIWGMGWCRLRFNEVVKYPSTPFPSFQKPAGSKSVADFGAPAAIWNNLPVDMLVVPDTGRGPRKTPRGFSPQPRSGMTDRGCSRPLPPPTPKKPQPFRHSRSQQGQNRLPILGPLRLSGITCLLICRLFQIRVGGPEKPQEVFLPNHVLE